MMLCSLLERSMLDKLERIIAKNPRISIEMNVKMFLESCCDSSNEKNFKMIYEHFLVLVKKD